MLPRTWSVSFVGIVPFTAISVILKNSAFYLDLTSFRLTNDGSHSVFPVIVIHVHCALSASFGTCVSKYTVFLSVLNGMNESSWWIPNRHVVLKGSSETGVSVIPIWLWLTNEWSMPDPNHSTYLKTNIQVLPSSSVNSVRHVVIWISLMGSYDALNETTLHVWPVSSCNQKLIP